MKPLERILAEKEARRRLRAQLSVPEKVRIIVELQKRRAPIRRMRGEVQRIWQIDDPPARQGAPENRSFPRRPLT